jgi:hypothetical protein
MIYSIRLARETAGPGEVTLESRVSRRELTLEYVCNLNNSLISLVVGWCDWRSLQTPEYALHQETASSCLWHVLRCQSYEYTNAKYSILKNVLIYL